MKLNIYQIDAFANQVFCGNPAAVCPLDVWLSDHLMQKIASENNLSETAFFVPEGEGFRLRWFTPQVEVDLCGHATLAAAYVISSELNIADNPIVFQTRSGELRVSGFGNKFTLDFPMQAPQETQLPSQLLPALGISKAEVLFSQDYLVVVESESIVRELKPDYSKLLELDGRGVIVTAPSKNYDFVSRWFGPKVGVNEDPVTGSAHCALTPYWSKRLNKTILNAAQISERGGELTCKIEDDRIFITGTAVKYLSGQIEVPLES